MPLTQQCSLSEFFSRKARDNPSPDLRKIVNLSHAFPFGDKREVELPEFPQVKMLKPKVLTEILGQAISGGVMSSL